MTARIDRGLARGSTASAVLLIAGIDSSESLVALRIRRPFSELQTLGQLPGSPGELGREPSRCDPSGSGEWNSNVTLGWTPIRLAGYVPEYRGPVKLANVDVESAQYAVWHGMGLVL